MKRRSKKINPLVRTLERECERYLRAYSKEVAENRKLATDNKRLKQLIRMMIHARRSPLIKKGRRR